MEEYSGGKIKKGSLYRVAFADIWQAKRDIANAVALPRNGMYWSHWASAEAYDEIVSLKGEIERLIKPPIGVVTIDMAQQYGIGLQDSTEALIRFREENQANYTTHLELNFPKEFKYRNNRFLFGLISYTCHLNGGRWKVDYAGTDEKLQRAIFAGSMFHTNTLEYVGRNDYHYGFKIKTAEIGDTEVYLKEPCNIKEGERCLIYGFDHIIGDDPPGTKYNQFMEIGIKSVDGDKITLSEPLKYRYDERWPDFPNVSFGKPRIISLDRLEYRQPKRAELVGGTITGSLQILADNVLLEDLIVEDYFWPALSKSIIVLNCHFKGGVELDKVGGELLCYNCTFDKHVTNGTGFDFIGLYDCTFMEGYEICPREYEVKNATVISNWKEDKWYSPVSEPPAQSGVEKATFETHRITRAIGNEADKAFNLKVKKSYKVVKMIDGNIILPYKYGEGDGWSSLIRCTNIDKTEISTADGRKGKVKNIIEGEGTDVIALWEGDEIKEGDVLSWYPLVELVDLGNHIVSNDFSHGLKPQIIS